MQASANIVAWDGQEGSVIKKGTSTKMANAAVMYSRSYSLPESRLSPVTVIILAFDWPRVDYRKARAATCRQLESIVEAQRSANLLRHCS